MGIQIEIKLDPSCREPKLILVTDRMTDEVNQLLSRVSEASPHMLTGMRDSRLEILEQEQIIRIFALSGKVYAATVKGEYTLRLRLYELEERLDRQYFVRISNSEIINLRQVKGFDLSFAGTICVTLSDGAVTYVSRRYLSKIKQVLGI